MSDIINSYSTSSTFDSKNQLMEETLDVKIHIDDMHEKNQNTVLTTIPINNLIFSPDKSGDDNILVCDDKKIIKSLIIKRVVEGMISQPCGKLDSIIQPRPCIHTQEVKDRIIKKFKQYKNDNYTPAQSPERGLHEKVSHNISVSVPITDSNAQMNSTFKELSVADLEKRIDDARTIYERTKLQDENMGIITPVDHALLREPQEIDFRRRTYWESCGGVCDRRTVTYFMQVTIGVSVVFFCMIKLWNNKHDCVGEDVTVYFVLLSALIGFFIPSPNMNRGV
jgi:hypothetical protein